MARKAEAFGEPGLVSPDIAPTTEGQRTLTAARERVLWTAMTVGTVAPALGRYVGESVWSAALTTSVVALVVIGVGLLLTPTAMRYGVGAGPLTRAAFGTRVAVLVHGLRYVVGVAWTAAHFAPFAEWSALLVQTSASLAAPVAGFEWTAPATLVRIGAFVFLALLVGWVARGRIRRSRVTARVMVVLATVCFCGLVVAIALQRMPGLAATRSITLANSGDRIGLALIDALVLVWSAPEWVRYRERHFPGIRPVARPLIVAALLAMLMVVVSISSQTIRGRSDGALIGDAAGAFGLACGWAAAVIQLGVTLAVLPLFGVLTASLALCSAIPRFRYPHVAYATAALAGALAFIEPPPTWLFALALPPLAAVLVDEWLVRKRAVVLDDLYVYGGTRVVPFIATVGGCAVIVFYRDTIVFAAALGGFIALLGSALPLASRAGSARRRKSKRRVVSKPDAWAEPLPMGENDWTQDETTRVIDPRD